MGLTGVLCPVSRSRGGGPGRLEKTLWFWGCQGTWGRWLGFEVRTGVLGPWSGLSRILGGVGGDMEVGVSEKR